MGPRAGLDDVERSNINFIAALNLWFGSFLISVAK
jgi:hypothetical protein